MCNLRFPVRFVGTGIHWRRRSVQHGVTHVTSVNRRTILPRNVPGERQFTIFKVKKSLKDQCHEVTSCKRDGCYSEDVSKTKTGPLPN